MILFSKRTITIAAGKLKNIEMQAVTFITQFFALDLRIVIGSFDIRPFIFIAVDYYLTTNSDVKYLTNHTIYHKLNDIPTR